MAHHYKIVYKKVIILLTFLAYGLTLVHGLVPHQHHNEAYIHHHHQNSEKHDHHDDNDTDQSSLGHVFSDAIHHPASDIVMHTPQSENIRKGFKSADIYIVSLKAIISPQLKPPDIRHYHQKTHYTSDPPYFFLLRAPPVA